MKSLWEENIKIPEFDSLGGDVKTDVLVVGGGLCGLLCAYVLKKSGVDCILAEADRICAGVTVNTTAKVTVQHGFIYDKIINKYGTEKARLYYESQMEAFEKIKELSADCDFKMCDSYVYSLENKEKIEREVKALEKIGVKAEFCEKTELPFDIAGAVKMKNQATFHPLKFVHALTDGLKIYENTRITELKHNTAITDTGKITAKKIIIATHFPFINKHGGYFLKMYQHRSYVLALKNAQNMKGIYVDESLEGLSFRGCGDLLLLGGGSHRTGSVGGNYKELEKVYKKYYPDAKEVFRWATQDCMTLDSVPYIGQYSKTTPDLYVATGFNKWGMTSSMLSAMILADIVCKRKNKYIDVYSPSRTILHPQLGVNIFESVKGLITPTAPRCPHLGCALKYNKQEHTWDCPCHGSRFDKDGNVLNNPANKDKE